jgi:inorganic pyrophosphatase
VFEEGTAAGMAFPYSFGFLPSTKGGDGDPLDVLVQMDEPAFPWCVLNCRVIGVIEGEQGNKKKKRVTIGSSPLDSKITAGPTLNKSATLETNSAVA